MPVWLPHGQLVFGEERGSVQLFVNDKGTRRNTFHDLLPWSRLPDHAFLVREDGLGYRESDKGRWFNLSDDGATLALAYIPRGQLGPVTFIVCPLDSLLSNQNPSNTVTASICSNATMMPLLHEAQGLGQPARQRVQVAKLE